MEIEEEGASPGDVVDAQGYMDANQGKVDRGAISAIAKRYHAIFLKDGALKPDVEAKLRAELKPVCGGFSSEEQDAVWAVTSATGSALDNPDFGKY